MNPSNTLKVTTPTDREIVITRILDAQRALVWEAMNQPDLLQRWLIGPPGWTMPICENDLRVGGVFRYVWRDPSGAEMSMGGVYREIVPPERVTRTECFSFGCEGQAGVQVATAVLAEQAGRTTLTITIVFPSKEARDATIASGMEQGMAASYGKLEDLLKESQAHRKVHGAAR